MRRIGIVLCCALMLVACGKKSDTTSPTGVPATAGSPTPAPTPCAIEGASTAVQKSENSPPVSPVTDVRYDDSGCPRVVFEFGDQVAGYKVEYAQPPITDCGSGKTLSSASWNAQAYLTVRLEPSGGPDMNGDPTYKGPRDIAVDGNVLKHLKVICDFEGVFQWVIGLDAKHPFEVVTFEDPPRLVINISQTT